MTTKRKKKVKRKKEKQPAEVDWVHFYDAGMDKTRYLKELLSANDVRVKYDYSIYVGKRQLAIDRNHKKQAMKILRDVREKFAAKCLWRGWIGDEFP